MRNKYNIPRHTGKLEKYDGAANFFTAEKQQKIILNFSLDSLITTE